MLHDQPLAVFPAEHYEVVALDGFAIFSLCIGSGVVGKDIGTSEGYVRQFRLNPFFGRHGLALSSTETPNFMNALRAKSVGCSVARLWKIQTQGIREFRFKRERR